MKNEITVTEAVRRVLKEMEPGNSLLGYQLYGRVLETLRKNGSTAHPLDSTVLRRVREQADFFGVTAKSGVSKYTKHAKGEAE